MYDHQTCTLGFTYNMKKRTARFLFSRKLESNFEVRLTHETTRDMKTNQKNKEEAYY